MLIKPPKDINQPPPVPPPVAKLSRVYSTAQLLSAVARSNRDTRDIVTRTTDALWQRERVYTYPATVMAGVSNFEEVKSRMVEDLGVDLGRAEKEDVWKLMDGIPPTVYGCFLQLIFDYKNKLSIQDADIGDSGIQNQKDIFEMLPIVLCKMILSYLDEVDLRRCVGVNWRWKRIADQVQEEKVAARKMRAELKGHLDSLRETANPDWRAERRVDVANESMFVTDKNLFCGDYNILVVHRGKDPKRVVAKDAAIDGKLVSASLLRNKPALIDVEKLGQPLTYFFGHAGSVTGLLLDEQRGFLVSSSYDASIRKWSLSTRRYQKIYSGHNDMVLSIAMHGEYLVSGSHDKSCKVWKLETGVCVRTFWHTNAVCSVSVHEDTCVSGCVDARVRVWQISTGKFVKNLFGHRTDVVAMAMDDHFIVTCAQEPAAFVWSAVGEYRKKVSTLVHPKNVNCVALKYLCAVTGCQDGSIRIFDLPTGDVLRSILSRNPTNPISQIILSENQILVNSFDLVLLLKFAPVQTYSASHKFCARTTPNQHTPLVHKIDAWSRCGKLLQYRNDYLESVGLKRKHIKRYKLRGLFTMPQVERDDISASTHACRCQNVDTTAKQVTAAKLRNDHRYKIINRKINNYYTRSNTDPSLHSTHSGSSKGTKNIEQELAERYKDKNLQQSIRQPTKLIKANTSVELKTNNDITAILNTSLGMERSKTFWFA